MKLVALAACLLVSLFCLIGCSGGADAEISKQPDATMQTAPAGGATPGAAPPTAESATPNK